MKRALAERAKQSADLGPPILAPPSVESVPPRKLARLDEESPSTSSSSSLHQQEVARQQQQHHPSSSSSLSPANPTSTRPVTGSTTSTSRVGTGTPTSVKRSISASVPRPHKLETPSRSRSSTDVVGSGGGSSKKRQRPGSSNAASADSGSNKDKSNDNDEADEASSFYLKHQNRALASELKGFKHQLELLEREREYRRQQCRAANRSMQKFLQLWTEMEAALQVSLQQQQESIFTSSTSSSSWQHHTNSNADPSIPASTGNGSNIEIIGSLLGTLAELGPVSLSLLHDEMDNAAVTAAEQQSSFSEASVINQHGYQIEQERLDNLSKKAQTMAKRAECLRNCVLEFLFQPPINVAATSSKEVSSLKEQILELQHQCRDYESQVAELAKARDEAQSSDRRARRGLYRLSTGRMKLEEVLKAVESQEGTSLLESFAELEDVTSAPRVDIVVKSESCSAEKVDSEEMAAVQKRVQDLEEIVASREEQIKELTQQREEAEKRITSLLFQKKEDSSGPISEEDVKSSSLFTEVSMKLLETERQAESVSAEIQRMKKEWSAALGEAEHSKECMAKMQANYERRWGEICNAFGYLENENDDNGNGEKVPAADGDAGKEEAFDELKTKEVMKYAKKVMELEHKLHQAVENVRQSDSVRVSLEEASKMNEVLSHRLEELKTKNATLLASKSAARAESSAANSGSGSTAGVSSSSTSSSQPHASQVSNSSGSGSSSSRKAEYTEKLVHQNRRMKKELAGAMFSKESAKAKQEKAEKERDALLKTNLRLLKQSAEKDDMNAKSLSTILHLKNLTDQLTKEKELLEEKAKSAQQLALAARLAANARDRVEEEAIKEKKIAETKLAEEKSKSQQLKKSKDSATALLEQTKAEMAKLSQDVGAVRSRCDELTALSAEKEEERRRLLESLAVTQRESAELAKRVKNTSSASGGSSGVGHSQFTVEQLQTHVNVLKAKLACDVCHDREKKCIISRCRHMFCRQCIDENLKNRSRKCPACGQRFDSNDVGDVWL